MIEAQAAETLVTEEEWQEAFKTFLSEFYIQDGRIAKVLKPTQVFGLPWESKEERIKALRREFEILRRLAPCLNPTFGKIRWGQNELPALIMDRIDQNCFLDSRLKRGENINPAIFEQFAALMINYHFNPEACPPVGKTLQEVLPERLQYQIADLIITQPAEADFYQKLLTAIQTKLKQAEPTLSARQDIRGHSDMKTNNAAFISRNGGATCLFIDPAPGEEWLYTDSRLDAAFFVVDTQSYQVPTATEGAEIFWQEYCRLYNENLIGQGLNTEEIAAINAENSVIDEIGRIRYLLVILQTALNDPNEQDPFKIQQAAWCRQQLKELLLD